MCGVSEGPFCAGGAAIRLTNFSGRLNIISNKTVILTGAGWFVY